MTVSSFQQLCAHNHIKPNHLSDSHLSGFVCWPSARGAGVQPAEPQHYNVQMVLPWWTWLVVVFLTLTDSHSRNKTLNAFVCASDIWHLCSILLNVLINAVPQRTVRDFSFLTRFYLEHFLKKKSILGSFFLNFFSSFFSLHVYEGVFRASTQVPTVQNFS